MKGLVRFFVDLVTKDPWRKAGAILFALLLWWYINQQITGQRVYTLELRPTDQKTWGTDSDILYVYRPPSRTLLHYGGEIQVTLEGPNKELDKISNLKGYFEPQEGDDKQAISLSDIRWDPSGVGSLAKALFPEPLVVEFSPIESYSLTLKLDYLDIQGTPPVGFEIVQEKIQFVPAVIELVGPHRSITKLKSGNYSNVFSQVTLLQEARDNHYELKLHPDLTKEALSIDGRDPIALIPLRPTSVSLPFEAKIFPTATGNRRTELLQTYSIQGHAEDGSITEKWIAEIPGPLQGEITEEWISRHVRFFVDFGMIPPELERLGLEVTWHLLEVDSLERTRFSGIHFRPAIPSKTKITVEKKTEVPGNGN